MMNKMFTQIVFQFVTAALILIGSFSASPLGAQEVFQGRVPAVEEMPVIPEISEYRLFEMDIQSLSQYVHAIGNNIPLTLNMGDISLTANLISKPSRKPGLVSYTTNERGEKVVLDRKEIMFKGFTEGKEPTEFRFAINDELLAGAFTDRGIDYIMEPLWWHVPDARKNLVIIYEASLYTYLKEANCGTDESMYEEVVPNDGVEPEFEEEGGRSAGCKEVEYGAAIDWSFRSKYGGTVGAWDRVDFVMGLVEFQYTGHFNWDFFYIRSAEYITSCSTCDPWTSSNDAGTLLSSFRSWGNGGGFGGDVYDVAGIWTNRDFDGGTVGIAYVPGFCGSNRYHALQDYSSGSWQMRVMVSHEIGHNLNAGHDGGSGFIMSPSVNNTSTWSGGSMSTINNFVSGNNGWCIENCLPSNPPTANFSASENGGCLPVTINFFDESANNPTSWLWTFPGGTPATSTMQNPTVTYNTKGSWNVTLVATNPAGSDTRTEQDFIDVNDTPITYFEFVQDENILSFINLHEGGTSFLWEFGDFNTSTEENPVHVYEEDGIYQVILSVTNECGTTSYTEFIDVVTTPFADFVSDVKRGCAPLTVNFEDMSSENTTAWQWLFPGGTPDSSKLQNPVVVYNQPGTYTVTLTASNSAGARVEVKTGYITVLAFPGLGFNYNVQIDSVFFNPLGTADSLLWEFGDGEMSKDSTPVHVYTEEGVYTVSLSMFTECGDSTFTKEVTVVFPPVAGFTADTTEGCVPLTVQFTDESSESATAWAWTFDGGNPANSSDQNPAVIYETPGTYGVTLVITNPLGNDTIVLDDIIVVNGGPNAGFDSEIMGQEVAFTNQSQEAEAYAWNFGDGSSSTEESPTHTYTANGTYLVTLVVTNECGNDTTTQEVVIAVSGQINPDFLEVFEVFPNPNNGTFVLHLEGLPTGRGIQIDIVDVLGRQIYAEKLDFSVQSLKHTIQLPNTASGAHFLRLWHDGKAYSRILQVVNR